MNILFAVIAVAAIGLVAGIGLSVASVLMSVTVDKKTEQIQAALPGANCGACGFSGCDGYAEAICNGSAQPGLCTVGGEATNVAISNILGIEISTEEPKTAYVLCNGNCDRVFEKFEYVGLPSCSAVNMLYSGNSSCIYGCLGYGDCQNACVFDAISVCDQKATVDPELCKGCGGCVTACPKNLITLISKKNHAIVLCSNKEKGGTARKNCTVSCIGCKLCEKSCEFDAISVSDNLAVVDPDKCTACGVCVEKCPQNCIVIK